MTELSDELGVGAWIKSVAEAATGLKAYLDLIPENHALPAIRFSFQARHDVYTVDAHAPFTRYTAIVLIVADNDLTSLSDVRTKDIAMTEALHRASGVVSGIQILECTRDGSFGLTESEGAHTYRHQGGTFVILARPA